MAEFAFKHGLHQTHQASFDEHGQLTFSQRRWCKEFEVFELPCRKCIHCRLETAREKAVRCVHHAQMTPDKSIFLTLTYDDDHLESDRLIYAHWQTFMKDLRNEIGSHPDDRISVVVTGEYGEKKKRPHWHALLFNFRPTDEKEDRTTSLGHRVFTSQFIENLWGRGKTEYGDVTFESAGYVARYAAKKLVHGRDQDHTFHPIHRTSSKNAIGKPWIEKYWRQTFERGFLVLPNGSKCAIPRYYEDWLRHHNPTEFFRYISTVKLGNRDLALIQKQKETSLFLNNLSESRHGVHPKPRNEVREEIQKQKHEGVLKGLKL